MNASSSSSTAHTPGVKLWDAIKKVKETSDQQQYRADAYMAALLSGPEPRNFRAEMQSVLEEVHLNYGQILYNWSGDMDGLKDIKRILDGLFIRMHLAGRPRR